VHCGKHDDCSLFYSLLPAATISTTTPSLYGWISSTDKLPLKISFLKRHLLAAPFKKIMGAVYNKKNPTEVIHILYRSQTEEAVWIKPSSDSVTIVYSIRFADKSDKILAKVFLSELADARRAMTSVPAVRYSTTEPPLELQGQRGVPEGDDVGFVSIGTLHLHALPTHLTFSRRG